MILKGKNRWVSFKMYNAYSNFIHHLYEFMLGAYARDAGNTDITKKRGAERTKLLEGYIAHHAQRTLNQRRSAIQNGTLYNKTLKDYTTELSKEKNNLIATKKRNLLLRKEDYHNQLT